MLSAFLSFAGYQGFAYILARGSVPFVKPDEFNPDLDKQATPIVLALAFFLVGAAAIGSYFSALTTATLNFPKYPTLALSIPLSFLGLSSLFISSLGRLSWFQDDLKGEEQGKELNPVKFLAFLGIIVPIVNLFAAMFLIVIPPSIPQDLLPQEELDPGLFENEDQVDDLERTDVQESDDLERPDLSRSFMSFRSAASEDIRHLTERTPLIIGGPEALYAAVREEEHQPVRSRSQSKASSHRLPRAGVLSGMDTSGAMERQGPEQPVYEHVHWNAKMLLKNKGLWGFGLILVLAIGPVSRGYPCCGAGNSPYRLGRDDTDQYRIGSRIHSRNTITPPRPLGRLFRLPGYQPRPTDLHRILQINRPRPPLKAHPLPINLIDTGTADRRRRSGLPVPYLRHACRGPETGVQCQAVDVDGRLYGD